jgi:hypothetical protein
MRADSTAGLLPERAWPSRSWPRHAVASVRRLSEGNASSAPQADLSSYSIRQALIAVFNELLGEVPHFDFEYDPVTREAYFSVEETPDLSAEKIAQLLSSQRFLDAMSGETEVESTMSSPPEIVEVVVQAPAPPPGPPVPPPPEIISGGSAALSTSAGGSIFDNLPTWVWIASGLGLALLLCGGVAALFCLCSRTKRGERQRRGSTVDPMASAKEAQRLATRSARLRGHEPPSDLYFSALSDAMSERSGSPAASQKRGRRGASTKSPSSLKAGDTTPTSRGASCKLQSSKSAKAGRSGKLESGPVWAAHASQSPPSGKYSDAGARALERARNSRASFSLSPGMGGSPPSSEKSPRHVGQLMGGVMLGGADMPSPPISLRPTGSGKLQAASSKSPASSKLPDKPSSPRHTGQLMGGVMLGGEGMPPPSVRLPYEEALARGALAPKSGKSVKSAAKRDGASKWREQETQRAQLGRTTAHPTTGGGTSGSAINKLMGRERGEASPRGEAPEAGSTKSSGKQKATARSGAAQAAAREALTASLGQSVRSPRTDADGGSTLYSSKI